MNDHEKSADRIIDQLRGYQRRQEWVRSDRTLLASILKEWEEEVVALEYTVKALKLRTAESESLNRHYERRLMGKGLGSYLKFLLGVTQDPV
jgi:hypothetical protein